MRTFLVMAPPRAKSLEDKALRLVFLRDGFSVLALIYPAIWLLLNRMWLVLICFLLAAFSILVAASMVSERLAILAAVMISVWFAFEARALRRWALGRRGWSLEGVVIARNEAEAEHRFFARWPAAAAADEVGVPAAAGTVPAPGAPTVNAPRARNARAETRRSVPSVTPEDRTASPSGEGASSPAARASPFSDPVPKPAGAGGHGPSASAGSRDPHPSASTDRPASPAGASPTPVNPEPPVRRSPFSSGVGGSPETEVPAVSAQPAAPSQPKPSERASATEDGPPDAAGDPPHRAPPDIAQPSAGGPGAARPQADEPSLEELRARLRGVRSEKKTRRLPILPTRKR